MEDCRQLTAGKSFGLVTLKLPLADLVQEPESHTGALPLRHHDELARTSLDASAADVLRADRQVAHRLVVERPDAAPRRDRLIAGWKMRQDGYTITVGELVLA